MESQKGSSILVAVIAIVVLVVISAIGYLMYQKYKSPKMQPQAETTQPTRQQTTTQNTIPDTLEKVAYSDTKHGFKINQPKGWKVDKNSEFGDVEFSNPQIDQERDLPFNSSIIIESGPNQGVDLRRYVGAIKANHYDTSSTYKTISEKEVMVNGIPAYEVKEQFSIEGYKFLNLSLMLIHGDKGYVVTAAILESTWDKYKDLLEASLFTFELK